MVDRLDEQAKPYGMADRWLTYQQAGELLGMSADAARQRARRLKWRTQPGNDGRALVLVPDDVEATPRVRTLFQPPGRTGGQPPHQPGDDNALADLLREQIERAEAALAAVQARAERAELRAEKAEAEREAARIAAAVASVEVAALQEQAKAEHGRAELARDEAAARVRQAEAARDAARTELEAWGRGGPIARALRAFLKRPGRP